MNFTQLASKERVERTIAALEANNIEAYSVRDGKEAKRKVFELLPQGASVMTMSSVTLDAIGVVKEIQESGKYDDVKTRLYAMDEKTEGSEMRRTGAAPEWAVGSVHAITENGTVMIASATGSQLPAYAYGAGKVIWVAGTHKIVKDREEGFKRIYEHSFPLENERAKKVYGMGSMVGKVLIVNKEFQPRRLFLVLVDEVLGF